MLEEDNTQRSKDILGSNYNSKATWFLTQMLGESRTKTGLRVFYRNLQHKHVMNVVLRIAVPQLKITLHLVAF